jgi:hypothetical protein
MADRVLPIVQLFFPCESATLDLVDEKWLLKGPFYAVEAPTDLAFPFQVGELFLYVQLLYGVGTFNLAIQFVDQESGVILATSGPIQRIFSAANRSSVTEEVFELRNLTFPRPGVYEFRLVGNHTELQGGIAVLRVLGGR